MSGAGEPVVARAGLRDLLRIAGHMAAGVVLRRRGFDAAEAGCRWARAFARHSGADHVSLPVPGRLEVVVGRNASDRILADRPGEAHGAGRTKRDAMRFLAPRALTIAEGEAWARLRPFNEQVLSTGTLHPCAQPFLDAVRAAFTGPVRDTADIRAAMAATMTRIVLGPGEDDAKLAEDVHTLFGVVQSPVRRRLLGWHYRSRRARLFEALARRWSAAGDVAPTLLARAHSLAGDGDRTELLEQVPHWMFTFTGSGTTLLARTLTLATSRPAVRDRLLDEIAAAGGADRAEAVGRLRYLNACLLETGRLFPPVTRTFHASPPLDGGPTKARTTGAKAGSRQLLHYFPLLQRDDGLGADVHAFRPERWLAGTPDPAAAASNLFLRGPRSCPGRDLIMFVCAAAIARLVGEFGVKAAAASLAHDPLPFSFPDREARFVTGAARVPHAEAGT